jgi:hypothetical protein
MLLIKRADYAVSGLFMLQFRHVCNTAKHLLNLFNPSVHLPLCMKQSENHVIDPNNI